MARSQGRAVRIVRDVYPGILEVADAGAVASGTATLDAALAGLPFLAVYRMPGATLISTIPGNAGNGLEGTALPSDLVAVTKAGTGAFLSTGGHAFSTRTARGAGVAGRDRGQDRRLPAAG